MRQGQGSQCRQARLLLLQLKTTGLAALRGRDGPCRAACNLKVLKCQAHPPTSQSVCDELVEAWQGEHVPIA